MIKIPAWAQPKVQYGICVVSEQQPEARRAGVHQARAEQGRAEEAAQVRLPAARQAEELGRDCDEAARSASGSSSRSRSSRSPSSRCRSSGSSPTRRRARCSTSSRTPSSPTRFVVTLKTSLVAQAADPALRDADRVSARDAPLPGPLARGHARRAAARAAAGRRGHRPARRARPLRPARLDACARSGSSSRSPRPRSSSPSPTSPARSTSAQAIAAFEAVDPHLTAASRTLGAGPVRTFFRVVLPLARGGLIAGLALSFARGIGEFGATIMFAGQPPESHADAAARHLLGVRQSTSTRRWR